MPYFFIKRIQRPTQTTCDSYMMAVSIIFHPEMVKGTLGNTNVYSTVRLLFVVSALPTLHGNGKITSRLQMRTFVS